MTQLQIPPITWRPASPQDSEMYRFAQWLVDQRGVELGPLTDADGQVPADLFRRLQAWSVTELPEFWDAIRHYFDVIGTGFETPPLTDATMPGATRSPHARLHLGANRLPRTRHL